MGEIRNFLESSTIHGFQHISSSKKYARLFWIFVVFAGFSAAFMLINTAFTHWSQSPIATTIETLPISKIRFPNVTVCPPHNSFLDLNYDIIKSKNIMIDNATREELSVIAQDIVQDGFHKEMMKNLSKLEDPERYYNWYHGYTKMFYPFFHEAFNRYNYPIETFATSGNISTQSFGDKFDAKGSFQKK